MQNLIKTENSDILKPYENTVALGTDDFYYVKTGFLQLDLTDTTCSQLRADPNYNIDQCKVIVNDIHSSRDQVQKAFQRALCDNKAAAIQLQKLQSRLNSGKQGLDDTKEFYNTMLIQTVNLAAGIVALLGTSVYFFNQ